MLIGPRQRDLSRLLPLAPASARMIVALAFEEILDIGGPEANQRAQFDYCNTGRTAGGMIAHPPFGNTEPLGHLFGVEETIAGGYSCDCAIHGGFSPSRGGGSTALVA